MNKGNVQMGNGLSSRSGVLANYRFMPCLKFSVTPSCLGHSGDVEYRLADSKRSIGFGVNLSVSHFSATGKKFPDEGPGQTTDNSMWLGEVFWSQMDWNLPDGKRSWYYGWGKRVGFGGSRITVDAPPQNVFGDIINVESDAYDVFSLSTTRFVELMFEPSPRFGIGIEVGLKIIFLSGGGEDANFGRIMVGPQLTFKVGWLPNVTEDPKAGKEATIPEIIGGLIDEGVQYGTTEILREELLRQAGLGITLIEAWSGQKGAAHRKDNADLSLALSALDFLPNDNTSLIFRSPLWAKWTLLGLKSVKMATAMGRGGDDSPGDKVLWKSAFSDAFALVPWTIHAINATRSHVWHQTKPGLRTTPEPEGLTPGLYLLADLASPVVGCGIAMGMPPGKTEITDGLRQACITRIVARFFEPDPMDARIKDATYGGLSVWSVLKGDDVEGVRGTAFVYNRLKLLDGHLQVGASWSSPYFGATDAMKAMGGDGAPEYIYDTPSAIRAEVDNVHDILKNEYGSIHIGAGLHMVQSYDQTDFHLGLGAQAWFAAFVKLGKGSSWSIGTMAKLYGSIIRGPDGLSTQFEFVTPPLLVRKTF